MENQTVIVKRRVRRDFTTLPNDLIRDKRLSWKAIGLVVYILHLPDNFRLRLSYLTKQKRDGRDSTRSGLKELENAGYLTIRRTRGDRGKFSQVIWEVTDLPNETGSDQNSPRSENPNMVKPNMENTNSDNPSLINTNTNKEPEITRTTTTTPNRPVEKPNHELVVGCIESMHWPNIFQGDYLESAKQIIQKCPKEKQQPVLDEIAGLACKGKVRSPIGLLNNLVDSAKQGKFVPAAGVEYQKNRRSLEKMAETGTQEKKRINNGVSPRAKEIARSHLTKLRKEMST